MYYTEPKIRNPEQASVIDKDGIRKMLKAMLNT